MCKFIYHEKDNDVEMSTPCQIQHYFSLLKEAVLLSLDNSGFCIFPPAGAILQIVPYTTEKSPSEGSVQTTMRRYIDITNIGLHKNN